MTPAEFNASAHDMKPAPPCCPSLHLSSISLIFKKTTYINLLDNN